MTSKRFRAPWAIFWVGFGLRVAVILVGRTYRISVADDHFAFGFEAGRIARSLVSGQGYANPFNGPSGPTAWLPPLYPLLLALAFKLFGVYTRTAAFFVLAADSVFSAAIAPAVYEIAARCLDRQGTARRSGRFFGRETSEPVALWAGWLWAVYPAALQYAVHWIWEMSLSTMLFAWLIVLTLRLRARVDAGVQGAGSGVAPVEGGDSRVVRAENAARPQARGWNLALWAGFGALWGLLLLSNASLALCLPAMGLWLAWPRLRTATPRAARAQRDQPVARAQQNRPVARARFGQLVTGALLAGVVTLAVMTPWIVRNQRTLHAFIPTRDNLGVELYDSMLVEHDGFPYGSALPVWAGDPEFQRYVAMGEVAFSRMRGKQAAALRAAHPERFWRWTVQRFCFYWDGTPHEIGHKPVQEFFRELSYSLLSVCGLLGLALMLRRRVPGAGLFAALFVLLPLPYYLVTVQPRFRHPLEPLIAVLAVYLFRSTEAKRRTA